IQQTGLLVTTDGGLNWRSIGRDVLQGQNVTAVAGRGNLVLAATVDPNSNGGGIFRSTDTGTNFFRISGDGTSGLPVGDAFDLVGDPAHQSWLFAAIAGAGVFQSTDAGATWQDISGRNFRQAAIGGQPAPNWISSETA